MFKPLVKFSKMFLQLYLSAQLFYSYGTTMLNLDELISAWQNFLNSQTNWQNLINRNKPKKSPCGLVYELSNFLNRPEESFAIADMSNIRFAEPHYHLNNTEIYFVIKGTGVVVVEEKEKNVKPGDVIIIPPKKSHFTIPRGELIIAVVNTPPFDSQDYYLLNETNLSVGFDSTRFKELTNF